MRIPSTPLGKAQALALAASREGPKDGSAYRAVEAAKQYAGVNLNMTYEAGLQALDPRNFSGPLWDQLTGIKSTVVELPAPDMYSKPIAEHIAGSGAFDVLDLQPQWTPALADGGVIAPLDDYIAKYMNMADLEDYHPLYKALPTYKGKTWGFFDDGDMFALYYRKDIFEDPKLMEAYQAKFNKKLEVPKSWEDYVQVAQFITDQMAPNVYGAGHFRKAGSPGNQFDFMQQYRANGGVFFDGDMKAMLASDAGVKTLENMKAANAASIPGNNELDAVSLWVAWLQGKIAMIYSWPPTGRMSAGYSQSDKAISFIPQSSIAGKVGYAIVPGGHPEHAFGFNKALAADSANPEAAYLFMQWACSPPVSLARCMLPYALRDPYRISHFKSELYGELFPSAPEYLKNLNNSANVGLLDPIMPGAQDYQLSLDRMCTSVWAGTDPMEALQDRRGGMGRDHRESRRRFAEGLLRGVPQAARRHRRKHGRGFGHGRDALVSPSTGSRRLVGGSSHRHSSPGLSCSGGERRKFKDGSRGRAGATMADAAAIQSNFPGAPRRRLPSASRSDWRFKWLLVTPAALLILAISIYPLVFSLWVIFVNYDFQIPGSCLRRPEEFQPGHLRPGGPLLALGHLRADLFRRRRRVSSRPRHRHGDGEYLPGQGTRHLHHHRAAFHFAGDCRPGLGPAPAAAIRSDELPARPARRPRCDDQLAYGVPL